MWGLNKRTEVKYLEARIKVLITTRRAPRARTGALGQSAQPRKRKEQGFYGDVGGASKCIISQEEGNSCRTTVLEYPEVHTKAPPSTCICSRPHPHDPVTLGNYLQPRANREGLSDTGIEQGWGMNRGTVCHLPQSRNSQGVVFVCYRIIKCQREKRGSPFRIT